MTVQIFALDNLSSSPPIFARLNSAHPLAEMCLFPAQSSKLWQYSIFLFLYLCLPVAVCNFHLYEHISYNVDITFLPDNMK